MDQNLKSLIRGVNHLIQFAHFNHKEIFLRGALLPFRGVRACRPPSLLVEPACICLFFQLYTPIPWDWIVGLRLTLSCLYTMGFWGQCTDRTPALSTATLQSISRHLSYILLATHALSKDSRSRNR